MIVPDKRSREGKTIPATLTYPIETLIVDFDETVSEQDTIDLIVQAAADIQPCGTDQFLAAWGEMVEWYVTRYNRIRNAWLSSEPLVPTSDATLIDFLKAFEELELASIRRVIKQGFLAGLSRERLRAVGQKVIKKPEADRVLLAMRAAGVRVEVLSSNWSKALIEGAMEGLYDGLISNCLVYDSAGRSTGDIQLRVVSARDKLKHFKKRRAASPQRTTQNGKTGRTLYVGDSISDFLPLLEADVGVLMGRNQTATQTIERFNIPTRRLQERTHFNRSQSYQGTMLLTDSWKGLDDFLSNVTPVHPQIS